MQLTESVVSDFVEATRTACMTLGVYPLLPLTKGTMSLPMSDADSQTVSEGSARAKVSAIFRELAGDRAERLCNGLSNEPAAGVIAAALLSESDYSEQRAADVAFHLTDWHTDAAFIAALQLYPERFTPAEIEAGVMGFLFHAPNHVAAAAALFGHPVQDIFGVGAVPAANDFNEPRSA